MMYRNPGASVNDVAALTFTHQSSVAVVIQRLVAERLVAKVAARHDRRLQRLELTAAGRRVLRSVPVVVQERLIAAISALPAAERCRFARTLADVARLVTPKGAAPHPPMLFEDGFSAGGRKANKSGRRRE
jgi:DNA-binding MarR family transcriptional regulator